MAAAQDILFEAGLAGVSMRKVAARCGISAAAIYRHFPDKDALVASTVGEAFRVFLGYLTDGLAAPDPIGRFRAMGQRYFDFAAEQPRHYQLIFMTNCEDLGYAELDLATRQRSSATFQLLVDRIVECQRAGLFQPGVPETLAAFTWSSLHGVAALHLTANIDAGQRAVLVRAQLQGVEVALRQGDFWQSLGSAMPTAQG